MRKHKTIYYVHRDYNHKHDFVIVVDTKIIKASILDRIKGNLTEWRYEDDYVKEYFEGVRR